MTQVKIIVEKHPDGYIAYPLIKGYRSRRRRYHEEAIAGIVRNSILS
jgi:hypothetical protein